MVETRLAHRICKVLLDAIVVHSFQTCNPAFPDILEVSLPQNVAHFTAHLEPKHLTDRKMMLFFNVIFMCGVLGLKDIIVNYQ